MTQDTRQSLADKEARYLAKANEEWCKGRQGMSLMYQRVAGAARQLQWVERPIPKRKEG